MMSTTPVGCDVPGHGAFGLRLVGLESASRYLVDAPADWPTLRIERVAAEPPPLEDGIVEPDWAEFPTNDRIGWVRAERDPLVARVVAREIYGDDSMIHPGLGFLVAVVSRWLGRDVFHAGAFMAGSGAWAVIGAGGSGKSSTLGHLAAKGVGIVTDDRLVVEDGQVFAGPRCVDLRGDVADWTGLGVDIGVVGLRRRWRLPVPPVPAAVPLRGWILPTWADRIALEPVPAAERLRALHSSLALAAPTIHPGTLMGLASLPFYYLLRPRRWEDMDAATAILLDQLDC